MPTFPSSPTPRWGSDGEDHAPRVKFESDGGYTVSRDISTRITQSWALSYRVDAAGFNAIRSFYRSTRGSFTFVTPEGQSITAQWDMEKFSWKHLDGYYEFEVKISEL